MVNVQKIEIVQFEKLMNLKNLTIYEIEKINFIIWKIIKYFWCPNNI